LPERADGDGARAVAGAARQRAAHGDRVLVIEPWPAAPRWWNRWRDTSSVQVAGLTSGGFAWSSRDCRQTRSRGGLNHREITGRSLFL
jgi:hypothetical protein